MAVALATVQPYPAEAVHADLAQENSQPQRDWRSSFRERIKAHRQAVDACIRECRSFHA